MKRRWENERVQDGGFENWVSYGSGRRCAGGEGSGSAVTHGQIHWLSKEEGDLENYLITGIEEKEIVEEEKNSMFELLKEQWDDILLHVKEEYDIMDVSFTTWLRPLKIYAVDGNVVKISAPDEQMIRYVKIKYGTILQVSIEEVTGFDCTVEFVAEDNIKKLSV